MRILRNTTGSRAAFDLVTITFHWLTAMLIAFQAATGFTLEFAEGAVPIQPLLDLHRTAGAMVWCVALTRIVWRGTFAKFPAFPAWMPNAQKWIATKTEYVLYALLLTQPLTGLATTFLLGKAFHLFLWTVPPLFPRDLDLWESLLSVHRAGAYCLFAVIGGHAGMALLHHYVFRDEVLQRVAPWLRERRPRPVAVDGTAAAEAPEI